jgi:hypothetical protein
MIVRRIGKAAAIVAMLALLPAFGGLERQFAPKADAWDRWRVSGDRPGPDHAPWTALLTRYVVERPGANLVRYAALKAQDRAALDAYVATLAAAPVSQLTRDAQFAYWVNLYNALTLAVVLDAYPVDSIRDIDISPGLFASGPWDKPLVAVAGEALTLNDIEHRILRPLWGDPRVHYAVNCASIGCPDLQPRAFTAAGLDAQLEAAARSYVNDPRGVRIEGDAVTVSKIYDWFIADFGGTEAGVLDHLRAYAAETLAARLKDVREIDDAAYDWSLNDAR